MTNMFQFLYIDGASVSNFKLQIPTQKFIVKKNRFSKSVLEYFSCYRDRA